MLRSIVTPPMPLERLQKIIAAAGIASRRKAEELITGGLVSVNGQMVSVTVTIRKRTVILSAVGLDDTSQTASASATALYGGTTQGEG